MYFHKSDFGIPAEWHFFPTAHGKGPCDGLGGTVKRSAASASLQLPHDKQILTPMELHEWFINSNRFKNIKFMFSPIKEYEKNQQTLKSRFSDSRRVVHLRHKHALIAVEIGLKCKDYSNSTKEVLFQLKKD